MKNTMNTKGNTEKKEKPKATQLPVNLDLRDYFAAKAMQGFISSGSDSFHSHGFDYSDACGDDTTPHDEYATAAYRLADAMLKAREP